MTELLTGIVLRTYPYREADAILRVLARERGKVSVIAKTARSSKKRFPGGVDLFDRGAFEVSQGKGSLLTLVSLRTSPPLRSLREDLQKLIAASLLCESYDLLVHDTTEDAIEFHDSLALGLQAIEDAATIKEALRGCYYSLYSLLTTSGYYAPRADDIPSAKNLFELVGCVERSAERDLLSKSSVADLVRSLAA